MKGQRGAFYSGLPHTHARTILSQLCKDKETDGVGDELKRVCIVKTYI